MEFIVGVRVEPDVTLRALIVRVLLKLLHPVSFGREWSGRGRGGVFFLTVLFVVVVVVFCCCCCCFLLLLVNHYCQCYSLGLREFNLGVDFSTLTNRLGLCYRANCPTQNHLQIGIKGQFGTYWYDCPEGGGKVSTVALFVFACNNTRFKIDLFFSPFSPSAFPCS